MTMATAIIGAGLTAEEMAKRHGLATRKPYVAGKLAKILDMEERGEISPIIRLEKSYLCNFQCTHCSAEYYMDRHLEKVIKVVDDRRKMDLQDVRRLSSEADELGLARFVITGGEPLVMRDFDAVVEAIDPEKHYIITDTNGWFLDEKRASHLKSIGVEKVQLSLDSFVPEDHDNFRNKKGSYKRVMRAVDASLEAGLNLILSTVLVKGRAGTKEFEDMCKFASDRGIGLYISYAKPTGSCSDHPEFVIDKEDADIVRQLEKTYKIFTHMTPSYGSFKGCITTKGIITVTSTMEVTPCPYIDMSLGNLRQTPLKDVLARGMRNPWMGPYRPDCIIGEDPKFIKLHMEKTKRAKLLPLPWGQGFSDQDVIDDDAPTPEYVGHFDQFGRCSPVGLTEPTITKSRHYFKIEQPALDLEAIHERLLRHLPGQYPDINEFKQSVQSILDDIARDPNSAGILKGVHVPFMLPQTLISDEGAALEEFYLQFVGDAFRTQFPGFTFKDHHSKPLTGTLEVLSGSRHDLLINRLSKGSVVGVYFPALREYSVPAALEKIAYLPERFLLAGGLDTAAALIACPDLLLRKNGYSPLLWLAALATGKEGEGYYFENYGYDLTFNRRMHFNRASEYSTAGLVVIR